MKRLLRVELIAQGALVTCATLFGVTFSLVGTLFEGAGYRHFVEGVFAVPSLVVAAYVSSVLLVVLIIAPLYTALEMKGRATVITVGLVGSIPGLGMLLYSATPTLQVGRITPTYAMIQVFYGVSVAVALYLFRTWVLRGDRAA